VGLQYRHPFCDRVSPILAAEYVTLEDGTGLVHTAPGHGADDYHTGLKNGLDVYCPVRDDGTFDDTVPEWLRGKSVWEGNDLVTDHLRESGHLFHHSMFNHSYPHDWRSKTPVIFRATEQWFIGVDRTLKSSGKTLRSAALAAADTDIEFVPAWGKNRLRGMLESRPDWCLSRQRAWGLPIPAFRTADGGTFLTAASVRAVAESFGARGSDAWFKESPTDLLASYDPAQDPDAPDGLDLTSLTKMNDIFDVWFESGTSWNAVMRQRGLGYPVDLYLEGSDQHRGWFQTSLLPAIGMTGSSPYKTLLTHGFCVDKDGRKMSKSGGNALDVDDVLTHYGADVCRWWVSSLSYEGDIKADMAFLEAAGETYRKIRNTLRFLLSNLDGFDHTAMAVDLASIPGTSLDAYILQEAMAVRADVMDAFVRYDFRRANQRLYDFCNDTLSAFYCAAVKDRLYCDTPDSPRRRRTQEVMWHLLELLTRLLAPILPHTADEAYRAMHGQDASIHEQSLDGVEWHVNADAGWGSVMAVREAASKALEMAKGIGIDNSLDAGLRLPDPEGVLAAFADDLADVLGVSLVTFDGSDEVAVVDLTSEPRCERSWKRDGTVRERSDGGMLSDRDAAAVGVS
jgi:isoleucyl-tRNA synthetase